MSKLEFRDFKKNVLSAMFERNAIERKHLPQRERLDDVVSFLYKNKPEATIDNLSNKEYERLFKLMCVREDKSYPEYLVPRGEDLKMTVSVFKELANDNKRLNDKLDADDLEVLCISYNALRFKKNRDLYLKNFSQEL